MATTEDQLNSFAEFVHQQLRVNQAEPSLAELFDRWLLENMVDNAGYAENVLAINASIDDYRRGERGTPAGEHSRQLRHELGIGNE